MSTWRPIWRSRSDSLLGSTSAQRSESVMDLRETSEMFSPSTVTLRTSGFSRAPPQVGHGRATMYFSSSVLTHSDSVSR